DVPSRNASHGVDAVSVKVCRVTSGRCSRTDLLRAASSAVFGGALPADQAAHQAVWVHAASSPHLGVPLVEISSSSNPRWRRPPRGTPRPADSLRELELLTVAQLPATCPVETSQGRPPKRPWSRAALWGKSEAQAYLHAPARGRWRAEESSHSWIV